MRTNCLVCGVSFDAPEGDEYPVCPDCTQTQEDPYDDPFDEDDERDAQEFVEEVIDIVRHIELPLDRIEDLVRNGVLRPVGNNEVQVINPEAMRQFNARINPPRRGYHANFPGLEEWQAIVRGERNIG